MKKLIDLSIGGADWNGWHFGPWGRAKDWRIHAPDGANYVACEIANIREYEGNINFFQVQIKQITKQLAEFKAPIPDEELAAVQTVMALLMRLGGFKEFARNTGIISKVLGTEDTRMLPVNVLRLGTGK